MRYTILSLSLFLPFAVALCSSPAAAQPRRATPVPKPAPPVQVAQLNKVLTVRATSLKNIDFANFEYVLGGDRIQLRKGAYERKEEFFSESYTLSHSWLDGAATGEPRFAVVYLVHFMAAGVSSEEDVALVYSIRGGYLVLNQALSFNGQVAGSGVSFIPATGKMTIKSRAADGSPHCCPAHIDISEFTWTPGGFVRAGTRRIPVANGN